MPVRLLHVSQPVEAGVPRVVAALVADQVARGHDVHVASPSGPGLGTTATALGATHHDWPAGRSPDHRVAAETRRLARIIDAVDPDVVVLHSAKAGLAGRLAIRGRRPTVFAPHAWSFEAVRGPSPRLHRLGGARRALDATRSSASARTSAPPGRCGIDAPTVVVPNGVDVDALVPGPAEAARRPAGSGTGRPSVCVGRLAEQKGQDLLLAAWAEVLARCPGPSSCWSATGRSAPRSRRPPDGVRFAGAAATPPTSTPPPTSWCCPLAGRAAAGPLEAMAMGRPVVAFDVQGVRAALGGTGAVLDPGDVRGLAAALARLLTDPQPPPPRPGGPCARPGGAPTCAAPRRHGTTS